MKLDRDDWVVSTHPDGSPAIFRKSRIVSEREYTSGRIEVTYGLGRKFCAKRKVDETWKLN